MAGIGFELRKLIRRGDYLRFVEGYAIAGVLSAGPWILSTMGILGVAVVSFSVLSSRDVVVDFLVSVTYLMALSLIVTGWLQFFFTRFLSDRIYEDRPTEILPNLMGALTVTSLMAGVLGGGAVATLFDEGLVYKILMVACFVTLCDMWVTVIFVSSIKEFKLILGVFAAGYGTTMLAALALGRFGVEGLLTAFFAGHALLLFSLLGVVVRRYPGDGLVAFDFLSPRRSHYSLAAIGLLYNVGIWADKFLFWFNDATSEAALGPLRFSYIYDLPVFLASLSVIPGMAVFLLRIETDFAEKWTLYYDSIREGQSLARIEGLKDDMVRAIRQGLFEIFKVQGTFAAFLIICGGEILAAVDVSPHSVHLFRVSVVGFALLVAMMAILNVLFYLDKRIFALGLTGLFAVGNVVLTILTQYAGPSFYGYGFGVSAFVCVLIGLEALSAKLDRHEYETFMLQS